MLETLKSIIGSKRTIKLIGKNMGESIIREMESKHDRKEWTPEDFIEIFIKGYLEEAGSEPEIVSFYKIRTL